MKELNVKHFLSIYKFRRAGMKNPNPLVKEFMNEFIEKLSKMYPKELVEIRHQSFYDSKGNLISGFPTTRTAKFKVINRLDELHLEYEIEEFQSLSCVINFNINKKFFCIQIENEKIGITQTKNSTEFCTIPDSDFLPFEKFEKIFNKNIQSHKYLEEKT